MPCMTSGIRDMAPIVVLCQSLTKSEHIKEVVHVPQWGRVVRTALELRPGGMFSIDDQACSCC